MKRRSFLQKSAAASAAFTIVPSFVLGGNHVAPSDTLYIGAIGVGGRGGGVVNELTQYGKVKFVALCDVDDNRGAASYKMHPKAKTYRDFRKLYDNHINDIDAIMVGTPDHTHATISIPFMRENKHAYVEKPLTHNIYEARLMAQVAKEQGIVTQMGNQGASSDGIRTAQEWINAGVIGTVSRVDCWTNRPVWPQGFKHITEGQPIPKNLDWDLWLGPASYRPYNENYLPFKWRGFWDFGTGAMGDMGCHIMETPFKALELGFPYEAEASCTTIWSGDFVEADYLSGLGKKAFMAEMMPRNPVYVCMLPKKAQKVIGEVHKNTKPALRLLQAEGFKFRNYVDIFDGGPTVECALSDIRSVKKSRLLTVSIGRMPHADHHFIISNTSLADYRASAAKLLVSDEHDNVVLSPEIAAGLLVGEGEQIRVLAM